MEFLSHPLFLAFLFVLAGLGVAWWYVRKRRVDLNKLPTIPASEFTRPGINPVPASRPARKHTPRDIVQRALRRGDKALGRIEGSSLPFLDTSPLTHQEDQAETDRANESRR